METKTVIAERPHVDVDGEHSITLEFSDGTEQTLRGFRKMEPKDVGYQLKGKYTAIAVVAIGDRIETWIVCCANPECSGVDHLGYYMDHVHNTPTSITVCLPAWGGEKVDKSERTNIAIV